MASIGGELNLSGLENSILRVEQQLKNLSTSAEQNAQKVINALNQIGNQGVTSLINKLAELQTAMTKATTPQQSSKSNPYAKNVDDINRTVDRLSKSSNVWTNLQKNIADNEKQIIRLTASIYKYEAVQRQIRAGGSGVVSQNEKKEYAENLKVLEVLKQQVASWKQKQQQIDTANKYLLQEQAIQQQIARGATMPTDSKTAQKVQELKQLNEYYRQQEIQMRKNYEAQAKLNQQKNQAYNTTTKGALEFSDNAKSINRQQKAIEYLIQARNNLSKADANYARDLERINQAINKHQRSIKNATMTDEQRAKASQRTAEALRREQVALERRNRAAQNKQLAANPKDAIAFSQSTKSINDQIRALQILKQARSQLTIQGAGGQKQYTDQMARLNMEINRQQQLISSLTQKTQNLGNTQRSLINTADQLQRRLALVFSVSAIQGYINKLVSVRAQFELHQRSLAAILQNKDAADKIWGQTVDLALKSPFRVKELVNYTKQLSAYRIETDKLHDTTKRLADVAAGLGVDMQRLILAYGQVRAAEYLRGTELRQFTEAGIPMLDELARKFSEQEQRAVSTAEVFERISKRMVEFGDVEEVFKRLTDAGGVFYNMQEIQSDTLHGQISNLHDAVDLMLNDIGTASDGLLKGTVQAARALVDNWEEVWERMKWIIIGFGTVKLSMALYTMGLARATKGLTVFGFGITQQQANLMKLNASLKYSELRTLGLTRAQAAWHVVINRTKVALLGLGGALKTFLPLLAISALAEWIMRMGEASREAERLNQALTDIEKTVSEEYDASIKKYEELAEKITNTTTSQLDRNAAMDELKRTYKDILPDYMLEIEYLDDLKENYGSLQAAMEAFYESKIQREQRSKLDESLKEDIDKKMKMYSESYNFDAVEQFIASKEKQLERTPSAEYAERIRTDIENAKRYLLSADLKDALVNYWSVAISDTVEDVKNGKIAADMDTMRAAIFEKFEKFYGRALTDNEKTSIFSQFFQADGGFLGENQKIKTELESLADILKQYEKLYERKPTLKGQKWESKRNAKETAIERAEFEKLKQTYDALAKSAEKYYDLSKKKRSGKDVDETEIKNLQKDINKYQKDLGLEVTPQLDSSPIMENVNNLRNWLGESWVYIANDFANKVSPSIQNTSSNLSMLGTDMQNLDTIPTPTIFFDLQNYAVPATQNATTATNELGTAWENFGTISPIEDYFSGLTGVTNDTEAAAAAQGQFREEIEATAESAKLTIDQVFTQGVIEAVANANGLSMDLFDNIRMESGQTLAQFHQNVVAQQELTLNEYLALKKVIESNPTNAVYVQSFIQAKGYGSIEEAKAGMKQMQDELRAYAQILNRTGYVDKSDKKQKKKKTKKDRKKSVDDPSDDYIELLENMYEKFQELSEDMAEDAAMEEVIKAYRDAFNNLLKGKAGFTDITKVNFKTTQGLVNDLKKIEGLISKNKDVWKKYKLTIAELESEIRVEKIREENEEADRRIDLLFEEYEMYKKIKDLGIDEATAKALYGIDATSIDALRKEVNALYGDVEQAAVTIDKVGKQMEKTYKGNVDLLNRKMIPSVELFEKGWKEAGSEGYATLFSSTYEMENNKGESQTVLVTPILPDGKVLSPDELDKYVSQTLNGANDILKADKKGLVIAINADDDGVVLHKLQEEYYNAKILQEAFGKERQKKQREDNDKINKEEQKQHLERLDKYVEYAKKSVSERAKLKLEELTRLAEIEETFAIKEGDSDEVKDAKNSLRVAAIEKSQKEYADALRKLEWDEFQKSDLFLMMFEDLDSANEKLIRNTLDKIKRYKEEWADMPLEDVRAMTEKINQLESALLKLKSPWNAIKDIDKTISETLGGKTREEVNAEAIDAQAKIDQNNIEIGQLETIRTLLAEGKYISSEQRAIYQQITGDTNANLETINAEIDARKDANKELNKPIETAKKLTKAEKDKINAYQQQAEAYDKINSEAQKLYDASKELIELFAGDDSIGMMFADMGMSIADSVLSTLSLQANLAATKVQLEAAGQSASSFGMQLNAAMGVVGWIVMGVQVISQVLGAIFGAKDKKLQKEIDKLDEDIEKLSKALEKLEDGLEKNYAFASLRSDMQKINSNIDQQIAKRRRQIELEKDKKETDKDQIKDWEDEIEELQEKRAELRKEMIESLGGVDDYRSATREFVDAWVDAFNETGNGLQGLTGNFREFFKNIILEQAVMKGAGKIMEPLLDEINMSLGDYEIQGHEEQKIKALSEQKMKELDEFLNVLFGDNGMWNEWIDDKGQSLSGLQEGIQGVTEETAQIIEAYLNSIRFYIAQDNQNLADLRNFFIGSEEDTNPMLSQLRIIAQQTTAIYDLLDSVSRSGHSQGGKGIKVFID